MRFNARVDAEVTKTFDGIERFLAGLPLFADLGGGGLNRFALGTAELRVPSGTVVFRQGESSSGLHLVVEGQVKISLQTAHGDEKVIELIGPGDSFGEAALFLGEPHIMTAATLADSTLLQLRKEQVLDEVERNPHFARRVIGQVCLRLNQRTRDLECCLLLSGTQRVTAYLLSRLPEDIYGRPASVLLPVKKGIIASRLNLTHEHFSRILREIQAAGLIEVRGREIRMIDVGRLRAYPG